MKLRVELSEEELKTAVKRYIECLGYSGVTNVRISHDGFTDSPDPRENGITYSATAQGEPPKRK